MIHGPGRVAHVLDRTVAVSHRLRVGHWHVHPYFLMVSSALLAGPAIALACASRFPGARADVWVVTYFGVYVAYELVFLPLKRRVLGAVARSYLQDAVLFLIPAFIVSNALFGNSTLLTIDLLGLLLPAVIALVRVGCFLGGCCYGVAWTGGVRYDPALLVATRGCWRYTPGDPPAGRVFPIQLLESLVNVLLFAVLARRLWHADSPTGETLPLYLLSYAVFRFAAERYRGARHRPRFGSLSEAQWTSVMVAAFSVTALWIIHLRAA